MSSVKDLSNINKIYFIGIGGIGISAAARILNQIGKQVLGSDTNESEITVQLEREGINVLISQHKDNIPLDTDLIVYTVAITGDNPEKQRADELNIPQMTYPQLLGLLMKGKIGIGISGTDGKTTTTAMLGKIFMLADLDPTIVIGSKVSYLGGNSCIGKGEYFIFESDEYKKAFHNYYPKIVAITNVRADHLDVYKDLEDIKLAFIKYLERVPKDGLVVVNNDDKNSIDISSICQAKIVYYAIDSDADITAESISYVNGKQKFKVLRDGKVLGEVAIGMPGKYNVYNTLAAISISLEQGISFDVIKKALEEFKGVWRRFENLGEKDGVEIITDYAHTPEGLKAVISATKELYKNNKILFVFQPHQYNRTKNFKDNFVSSIKTADDIIISDIFYVKGRENPKDFNISSKDLAKEAGVVYGGNLEETENIIKKRIKDYDVVIFIGAGDIYNLAKSFLIN